MRIRLRVPWVFALTAVLACSVSGWAQRPGGQQRPGGGPRGGFTFDRLLERHDKNKDGKVTREEWQGPAQMFDQMDRNSDGVVVKDEFEARMRGRGGFGGPGGFRGGPGGSGGRPQPQGGAPPSGAGALLRLLDANRDGSVSKDELEGFFKKNDSDKNDSLSEDELKKAFASLGSSSAGRMARYQNFPKSKPAPGQPAPQFELRSLEGETHSLVELLKSKPVVIEFGSFT